jgi:hypothetical protein
MLANIIIDTGCAVAAVVSDRFARFLDISHFPRTAKEMSGTYADATTAWHSRETVEIPVDLQLSHLGLPNRTVVLNASIMNDLATDILIGWPTIKQYSLTTVLTQLATGPKADNDNSPLGINIVSSLDSPHGLEDDTMLFPVSPKPNEMAPSLPEIDPSYPDPSSLLTLTREYQDIFSNEISPEPARIKPLKLSLSKSVTFSSRMRAPVRRQCKEHDQEIKRQVDDMIAKGIIRPCNHDYYSQVLLVKKADGSLRFCIDYRDLNRITEKMSWPLPRIDAVLASLAGNRFFAVLDLTAGYHQMPLDPDSAYLTAFITSFGMFCGDRVPFGIQVAPAYFQKAMMEEVLPGLVYRICNVYIDDVIVFAKSPEELVSRLREVFEQFR